MLTGFSVMSARLPGDMSRQCMVTVHMQASRGGNSNRWCPRGVSSKHSGPHRNALTLSVGGGYDVAGTNSVLLHTCMDNKVVSRNLFRIGIFRSSKKSIKCLKTDK